MGKFDISETQLAKGVCLKSAPANPDDPDFYTPPQELKTPDKVRICVTDPEKPEKPSKDYKGLFEVNLVTKSSDAPPRDDDCFSNVKVKVFADEAPRSQSLLPIQPRWLDTLFSTKGFTFKPTDQRKENLLMQETGSLPRVKTCRIGERYWLYEEHPILDNLADTSKSKVEDRRPVPGTAFRGKTDAEVVELVKLIGPNLEAAKALYGIVPSDKTGRLNDIWLQESANADLLLEPYAFNLRTHGLIDAAEGVEMFFQNAKNGREATIHGAESGRLGRRFVDATLGALPFAIMNIFQFFHSRNLTKKLEGKKVDAKTFLKDVTKDAASEGFSKVVPSDRVDHLKTQMSSFTKPSPTGRQSILVTAPAELPHDQTAGVGKSEVIYDWFHDIATGVVEHLKGHRLTIFDSGGFAKTGGTVGATDRAMDALDEAVKKKPTQVILVKEAHLLRGIGAAHVGEDKSGKQRISADILERLKLRLLAEKGFEYYKDVHWVFDTNETQQLTGDDTAWARRTSNIEVIPPEVAEQIKILEKSSWPTVPESIQINESEKAKLLQRVAELAPLVETGGAPARSINTFDVFVKWLVNKKISGEISDPVSLLVQCVAEKLRMSPDKVKEIIGKIDSAKGATVLLEGGGTRPLSEQEVVNWLSEQRRLGVGGALPPAAVNQLLGGDGNAISGTPVGDGPVSPEKASTGARTSATFTLKTNFVASGELTGWNTVPTTGTFTLMTTKATRGMKPDGNPTGEAGLTGSVGSLKLSALPESGKAGISTGKTGNPLIDGLVTPGSSGAAALPGQIAALEAIADLGKKLPSLEEIAEKSREPGVMHGIKGAAGTWALLGGIEAASKYGFITERQRGPIDRILIGGFQFHNTYASVDMISSLPGFILGQAVTKDVLGEIGETRGVTWLRKGEIGNDLGGIGGGLAGAWAVGKTSVGRGTAALARMAQDTIAETALKTAFGRAVSRFVTRRLALAGLAAAADGPLPVGKFVGAAIAVEGAAELAWDLGTVAIDQGVRRAVGRPGLEVEAEKNDVPPLSGMMGL